MQIKLPIKADAVQMEINDFIAHYHKHHKISNNELKSAGIVPPIIQTIYHELLKAQQGDISSITDKLTRASEEINECSDTFYGKAISEHMKDKCHQWQSSIIDRDNTIEDIFNSRSWKIAAPLRSAGRLLRKLRS